MELLLQFFDRISNNPVLGWWVVFGLFGCSVFILVIEFYLVFSDIYNPTRNRVHFMLGRAADWGFFRNTTSNLGGLFVVRGKDGGEINYDRERLIHAGYHGKNSLAHYLGIKIMLTIGLPLLVFLTGFFFFPQLETKNLLMFVGGGFVVGLIGPSFILDGQVTERKKVIRNSFANVIDQLLVCTEAGLGIDEGLVRVARLNDDVFSYELNIVNAELSAGITREQAFKNLVNRTGVEEIRGLTTALIQSIRFGTSIGNTLRIYAEDLRDRRMQNAEQEAAKLAIKMLLPLSLCFFPCIFIIILGSAIISISETMG